MLDRSQKKYIIIIALLALCFPALMLYVNINMGWTISGIIVFIAISILAISLPIIVYKEQKGTL